MFDKFEGATTDRRGFEPIAQAFDGFRGQDVPGDQYVQQVSHGFAQGQADRLSVKNFQFHACQVLVVNTRSSQRDAHIGPGHTIERKHNRFGVRRLAIVKFHARPEIERPPAGVFRYAP